MVHYFASATTFLALTSISATTIQAKERSANLRRNDEQQSSRKLYGGGLSSSHFVSDTVTDCEEVMVGNPPICVNVCVEVTSITNGGMLVEETSKASQRKCKSTNIAEETTGSPTNHPTYLATKFVTEDDETIITHTYSPDTMKLANEEDKVSSSAIDWNGDGYTSTANFESNSIIQNGISSKSSKDGFVTSSKGGKIASSAKSSKSEFVSNGSFSKGSSKSAKSDGVDLDNVVISDGWSGSGQTTSDNVIRSSKSSKYSTFPEDSSDVLDANGWYSSAQGGTASVGSAGSSKSSKSGGVVENVATSNGWFGSSQTIVTAAGSSKSSKSEGLEENVTSSNSWYGSSQTISTDAGSSKSSKSEGVEEVVVTSDGWSGSAQVPAMSSSKSPKSEGRNSSGSSSKGGKGGDSGDTNAELVTVSKPQYSNGWQSDGWQ